jgi:peroxidase
MREHNRIAKKFSKINPHWDGEKIYQESRKIVGAIMQHITYEQWLPLIIGIEGMNALRKESGYDVTLDPTIRNEFATAAFRFGHTLINPILHRFDHNLKPIMQGHLPLHKAFFAPWRIVYEGGVDPLLRGLFISPAKLKLSDQTINSELTEKLFLTAHAVALDLAAINIQRGRDHGIPAYNKFRKLCNLSSIESFNDLLELIPNRDIVDKLETLYGHPDNIDLFVGGILETPENGARVGPLFKCLLIDQFRKLRDGDRFWYGNELIFTKEQLLEIKKMSISKIICENADNITTITENAFVLPNSQNSFKNCNELPEINFQFWTDCSDCSRSAHNLDVETLNLV